MNEKLTYTQFVLFCKVHHVHLLENIYAYSQIEEQSQLIRIEQSFLQLFTEQKIEQLTDEFEPPIRLWLQSQRNELSSAHFPMFRYIFEQSIFALLIQQKSKQHALFSVFLSELFLQLSKQYEIFMDEQQRQNVPLDSIDATHYIMQLDHFSRFLIGAVDSNSLPAILHKAEEIFGYKRCVFYAYNPWLNEVHGVYGAELLKVQNVRGKLNDTMSVFSAKKTIFLRDPTPYLPESTIASFQLSSIVFTPIFDDEHQLYGWLTFDQMNEPFDLSEKELEMLEEAGKRFAIFLSRKVATQPAATITLTEREKVVLNLLADGQNNKEMATLLFLSEHTIRDYVQRLMKKIHAKNRTQVVSKAFRLKLLT